MVLLDAGAQVTIVPIAYFQLMGFGQDSVWGKEVNAILWLGLFWPTECPVVVASTAGCIIDLGVLHACPANAHRVQHVRYL